MTVEDILHVLRGNKELAQRVSDCLKWKEVRKNVKVASSSADHLASVTTAAVATLSATDEEASSSSSAAAATITYQKNPVVFGENQDFRKEISLLPSAKRLKKSNQPSDQSASLIEGHTLPTSGLGQAQYSSSVSSDRNISKNRLHKLLNSVLPTRLPDLFRPFPAVSKEQQGMQNVNSSMHTRNDMATTSVSSSIPHFTSISYQQSKFTQILDLLRPTLPDAVSTFLSDAETTQIPAILQTGADQKRGSLERPQEFSDNPQKCYSPLPTPPDVLYKPVSQRYLQRLREADEVTRKMTREEYLEFAECRQASFTYKKIKKFRDWLNLSSMARLQVWPIKQLQAKSNQSASHLSPSLNQIESDHKTSLQLRELKLSAFAPPAVTDRMMNVQSPEGSDMSTQSSSDSIRSTSRQPALLTHSAVHHQQMLTILKPNDDVLEVFGFLAWDLVALLTRSALLVQKEQRKRAQQDLITMQSKKVYDQKHNTPAHVEKQKDEENMGDQQNHHAKDKNSHVEKILIMTEQQDGVLHQQRLLRRIDQLHERYTAWLQQQSIQRWLTNDLDDVLQYNEDDFIEKKIRSLSSDSFASQLKNAMHTYTSQEFQKFLDQCLPLSHLTFVKQVLGALHMIPSLQSIALPFFFCNLVTSLCLGQPVLSRADARYDDLKDAKEFQTIFNLWSQQSAMPTSTLKWLMQLFSLIYNQTSDRLLVLNAANELPADQVPRNQSTRGKATNMEAGILAQKDKDGVVLAAQKDNISQSSTAVSTPTLSATNNALNATATATSNATVGKPRGKYNKSKSLSQPPQQPIGEKKKYKKHPKTHQQQQQQSSFNMHQNAASLSSSTSSSLPASFEQSSHSSAIAQINDKSTIHNFQEVQQANSKVNSTSNDQEKNYKSATDLPTLTIQKVALTLDDMLEAYRRLQSCHHLLSLGVGGAPATRGLWLENIMGSLATLDA